MLTVYNTLTRTRESFEPLHPPFVGMYVCGPTVYDDPHLGHAKSYVSFDVMVRFLRASGFQVRYVQNITDVGHLLGDEQEGEDRILKKARLERLEPVEVAQKYERHYFRDMDRLNNLRPDISCRATGHIPEMLALVKTLVDRGVGYESQGNVYYDIDRFSEYGKLSGRRIEELREGTRIQTAEDKRHPADFALWKKAEPGHLMQWDSPWGRGYPGWHLECSVMAMKYLGESIDIHGGGLDNQFPHHECEIAQSEAATGKPFVKYWLHNNMVTIDGQKMSKSLGNFITLEDLFKKYDPMTVRFFILQGHYRSPQDFSDSALDAADRGFTRLQQALQKAAQVLDGAWPEPAPARGPWSEAQKRFFGFMEDDFNTAGALSVLFDMLRTLNTAAEAGNREETETGIQAIRHLGETILGLKFSTAGGGAGTGSGLVEGLIGILIGLRREFRGNRDFAMSDRIRDRLLELGVVLEDGRDATRWSLAGKSEKDAE